MSPTRMSVDVLLENAHQIDTGRIRRLALGVRTAAIELDNALVTERRTRRIGDLRRELHNLEVQMVGVDRQSLVGADRAASVDYDPAMVRTWAKANGWDAPGKGRYLPDDLVAAYRAHPTVSPTS